MEMCTTALVPGNETVSGYKGLGDYNPDCKAEALLFKTQMDEAEAEEAVLGLRAWRVLLCSGGIQSRREAKKTDTELYISRQGWGFPSGMPH